MKTKNQIKLDIIWLVNRVVFMVVRPCKTFIENELLWESIQRMHSISSKLLYFHSLLTQNYLILTNFSTFALAVF